MNKLIFVVLALAAVTAVSARCHKKGMEPPEGESSEYCTNGLIKNEKCGENLCYNPYTQECQPHCVTGHHGVPTCARKSDGHYQHCYLCTGYVSCVKGRMYERKCPINLFWDDCVQKCLWKSKSCILSVNN